MTDWDGATNLHDLGGLPRVDGSVTAAGRVFRSGRTESITLSGWIQASEAGVTTIVDLRNADEIGRRAGDPSCGFRPADIVVANTPTEAPDDPEFESVLLPWLDHPASYADNLRLYPQLVASVFSAIAAADGAVLIHCAGGRDRTGMVAAMLLRLNGATVEAIADDYERGVRGANATLRDAPNSHRDRYRTEAELAPWLGERRAALVGWISPLDVADFLRSAGIADDVVDRLSTRLTAAG
jgi:hypothetical protein